MKRKIKDCYELITKRDLKPRFCINERLIKRNFPAPSKVRISKESKGTEDGWELPVVERVMQNNNFIAEYYDKRSYEPDADERSRVREKLISASNIKALFAAVTNADRKFILHIGPTNSGKTFQALKNFDTEKSGIYLAPLRLLALEVFENLNENGLGCSLLTGEEEISVPYSRIIASTIEMSDFNNHYDVAVIDECQMISDEQRGQCWTRAILQLDADEIHLCMAPEAADIIKCLLNSINANYTVKNYERLVPLKFGGSFNSIDAVQPGDALIAFSRKKVLSIAAELEDKGIKTSVIYGWLPPSARREEVRRFNSGESSVLVATDAIGMGVSLPIKRIIFCETEKWADRKYRSLSGMEIRQIAGRAGRYGKFDVGEVLTMRRPELIKTALAENIKPLRAMTLPFPYQVIDEDINLKMCIEEWERLLLMPVYRRERLTDAYTLLKSLNRTAAELSNNNLYKFIKCPFDTSDAKLVAYWLKCCRAIIKKENLPEPDIGEEDLTDCEIKYRAYEIRYRLAKAFGLDDNFLTIKYRLCVRITSLLLGSKSMFMARCNKCGCRLPAVHVGAICQACELKERMKVAITPQGYVFKNKIEDIARFVKVKHM